MQDTTHTQERAAGNRLRREIGIVGLLFSAVGSIIGSGWLFGALYAAQAARLDAGRVCRASGGRGHVPTTFRTRFRLHV